MNHLLLTTDGRAWTEVEARLRHYLPGLDCALWPTGPTQALLRAPLRRALAIEYPSIGVGPLLQVMGVARTDELDDETAARLVALRDTALLPPRAASVARRGAAPDWHLQALRAPQAWALLGGPGAIDWRDVRVGHPDTGYVAHPAFGFGQPGGPWVDTGQARTLIAAVDTGVPVDEPGGGIDPLSGISASHGTRVGTTIAGHAPQDGFFGVAPKVPLVPVRITDSVWINHAQDAFAQAVDHLVRVARVSVINCSLGCFASAVRPELRAALNQAYEAGVILCCAAGNIVNDVVPPAALPRSIAAGGVTSEDRPWSGSAYGPETDWSAPAAGLRRADVRRGGRLGYADGGDGTSYAAAISSAAAALWLARHGAALDAAYPQPWQRVEAFRHCARASARVPALWNAGAFGSGILDLEALLQCPLPQAAALTKAPAA
ncbi:S8/S53 family peptidase [Ideonella sp. 4Y16]|uniref:S8/S53 family peptidase n=1 Tax=Ideonella alba TaxID=2824118 RepID=A0A940YA20_9BURK|nr:S8/S53 family peptidase [Ideonella alba]MBQ0932722.1 S8/S53 family peptidase [Ideonella alba]MBQ0946429.1 S8/S53 family peptidase [Ideonella alba]